MNGHVAVLGTGRWSEVHLAAHQASPYVSRVTLCGRKPRRLAELAGKFPKVTATVVDPRQLFASESVDVVDIVLPHDLHAPMALKAFEAGKHVICEKPAALSLDDFDRVVAAANQASRRLLVVMNQLYNPRLEQIERLVANGLVGRPFLLIENSYSDHSRQYREAGQWRTRLDRSGGGVLIDGGFHMVYKHLALLGAWGPPRWVSGETAQLCVDPNGFPVPGRGEDFVAFTVGFEMPLRIAASHAWTLAATPKQPHQQLLSGSGGTLEMAQGVDGDVFLCEATGRRSIELPKSPGGLAETLHLCLIDYLAALAEDRPPLRGSVTMARQTLALILAVYESSRRGERVGL